MGQLPPSTAIPTIRLRPGLVVASSHAGSLPQCPPVGRITIEQFVAVTSTNAAKIFGMYPRKGVIRVGSDADIVIWDPTKKKILNDKDQFSKAGYSTYAGKEVTGLPITTIRRGEVVYDNGKILAKPGSGKFIPGSKFQRPTLRPLEEDMP